MTYSAAVKLRMVEAGARFVGGGCGNHLEHIRAISSGSSTVSPRSCPRRHGPHRGPRSDPVPLAERSRFGAKLAEGEFVTTVEIVPPKGVDPAPMFDQCRALKAAGWTP